MLDADDVVLMSGDVVVTKSGKMTYGLERFFSSLWDDGASLCFLSLSLLSVTKLAKTDSVG